MSPSPHGSEMRLIVNADDLGCSPAIDRGIFLAFEAKAISSASLLANGPSFAAAARECRTQGLPLGVHLNLCEGEPLCGPIRGLTGNDGRFAGKEETRRRLAGGDIDRDGLRRELTAQISRVRDAGLLPDHLDTHQHTFLFPAVAEAVMEAARAFAIRALRLPRPAEPAAADPPGFLGQELGFYRRSAPAASALRSAGFACPDGLWGMPLLNCLDEPALCRLVAALPPGVWELMVHPGCRDPGHPFGGPERETELQALTSGAVRRHLRERGIRLIDFGAL